MKLIKYKFTAFTLIIFITSCDVKLPYRNRQVNEPITLGIIVGLPLVLFGSYLASRKSKSVVIAEA